MDPLQRRPLDQQTSANQQWLANPWTRREVLGSLAGLSGLALAAPSLAFAQPVAGTEEKPIPPETVTITTKDGVLLKGTFWASRKGKEAVPVVLLHQFRGSREDYGEFAPQLQKAGHAVLAVDLRGHGESTRVTGIEKLLEAKNFANKIPFEQMITQDLEAVKAWLLVKNNDAELNIEKLTFVAAEMSTTVVINWSAQDWIWPDLAGGLKQGRDVKALVLLTPMWNFKGLSINAAIQTPAIQREISMQIVVGEQKSKEAAEAAKLFKALDAHRKEYTKPEDIIKYRNLFFDKPKTEFQGTKLLGQKTLGIDDRILKFIELRLVNQDYPWTNRKSALG